jgi:hypothetical protein
MLLQNTKFLKLAATPLRAKMPAVQGNDPK